MVPARKNAAVETTGDIAEIWNDYFTDRSNVSLRNILVEHYLPQVHYYSKRLLAHLPREVELGYLVSAGTIGLIQAVSCYDAGRSVKFETYCKYRICGAIRDWLRTADNVSRQIRSRSRTLAEATKLLADKFGRLPTDEELSAHLRVSLNELKTLVSDAIAVKLVSLDKKCRGDDDSKEICEIDIIADSRNEEPASQILKDDVIRMLTKGLSQKERNIILLYYYHEMTMKEIGLTLDLSESRVSQIHNGIINRLKRQLKTRRPEFI